MDRSYGFSIQFALFLSSPVMAIMWPDTSRGRCPMVLLRHELPNGAWHVDWMLAREPEAASRLMSFRLARPLHEAPEGAEAPAEHIQDHRVDYLNYEGPISGNRGVVRQIAQGTLLAAAPEGSDGAMRLQMHWYPVVSHAVAMAVVLVPAAVERESAAWRVAVRSRESIDADRPPA